MKILILNIFFLILFLGSTNESINEDYLQSIPGTNQKVDMVYIPGGTFSMGSPKSEKNHFGDEGPQHEIEIASFWMGKYEITWDIYELFMAREIDSKKPTKALGDEVSIDVDAGNWCTQPYTDMSLVWELRGILLFV